MIKNISYLVEHWWFYKKKLEENTNLLSCKISDFTDFDKIFYISQVVLRTLPILTKYPSVGLVVGNKEHMPGPQFSLIKSNNRVSWNIETEFQKINLLCNSWISLHIMKASLNHTIETSSTGSSWKSIWIFVRWNRVSKASNCFVLSLHRSLSRFSFTSTSNFIHTL
jgi:hypothetical protein